jgi:hypothetical protein
LGGNLAQKPVLVAACMHLFVKDLTDGGFLYGEFA